MPDQLTAFLEWHGSSLPATAPIRVAFNAGYVKGMLGQMERIKVLEDALKGAMKLPRPWMDGGVTFEDWCEAFDKIEAALAGKARPAKCGPCKTATEEQCSWPMCEC